MSEESSEKASKLPLVGDVCWLEIPATDMARCQTFYKTVFGWEFATLPSIPKIPTGSEVPYVTFTKPDTRLCGGIYLVKEEDLVQLKLDSEGKGQATNRFTMRVEEVDAALKSIEVAGGKIIRGKNQIGGDMGYAGMFRDTEGNVHCVWSMV